MLVAIEGIDGCGKGTQTARLSERAKKHGFSVATFSFPRYGTNAYAEAIGRYLNGEFGTVAEVPAEFAALLYAGDRLGAREELRAAMGSHDLVLCDRYVPSNLAHQAAKLPPEQRPPFLEWLTEIEYGIHQLPRPDVSVRLKMPVEMAMKMVTKKRERSYTTRKADIHEADQAYLQACSDVYDELEQSDPGPWAVVDCLDGAERLHEIDTICDKVWSALAIQPVG